MEEWKDIPGYEGLYQASTLGRIRSLPRNTTTGQIIKGVLGGKPHQYLYINCWIDGINFKERVHRLVALTFLPNPENKETVDHINRDKLDNRVENLRWATQSEQNINSNRPIGVSNHRSIIIRGNSHQVNICRNGKRVYCKSYSTLEGAIEARDTFLAQL